MKTNGVDSLHICLWYPQEWTFMAELLHACSEMVNTPLHFGWDVTWATSLPKLMIWMWQFQFIFLLDVGWPSLVLHFYHIFFPPPLSRVVLLLLRSHFSLLLSWVEVEMEFQTGNRCLKWLSCLVIYLELITTSPLSFFENFYRAKKSNREGKRGNED